MKKLALMMTLAALLAGCRGSRARDYSHVADAGVVADGDARVDASGGDAAVLNPVIAGDSSSDDINGLVFNGLVRYNPKFELEGDLAKSWDVLEGGRRIVFHLRSGVRWQDGQPFTSADVAFTYHAIMDPKLATPRKGPFDLVDGVDTPDPSTVVVRYKKPFAPALESWSIGMVPEHLLKGQDLSKAGFNRHPVGTGPYAFVSWTPNQSIELKANPDYYEGKPHIGRYLYRIIPDASARLLELKTQGIDTITLMPDQYAHQTNDPAFNAAYDKYRYPSLNTYTYFGFNLARPMFQDKRVRKALSMAIDRTALIDAIQLGLGRPCSGPYSPMMPAYNPAVKPVELNLAGAAALLDQAGWKLNSQGLREKDGKPMQFNISTNQGNKVREQVATVLQEQFKKIGVKAEVQVVEWSTFVQNYLDKKNFDATVMGWQLSLDPDIYDIWHSSKTHPGEFNFVSYKNPVVDRLLEQGRTTFDHAKRIQIYRRIHAILAEDEPVCFLFAGDDLSALHKRFHGLVKTDAGYTWYWPTRWYVPKSIQLYP